ncbi:uncharacterized protein LOC121389933 [Gigantopelta aegis]|uniref:uncharacterized protein LOC121389933 n=1 Tax=Gigantopelta aegis TaxID=1735272 RepID=UPI001B8879F7|nr:uncharacterized protein LOC121389933 [Gigantopelta aegis]
MDFRHNLKPSKLDLEFPLATLKKNMAGKDVSFFDKAGSFHRSFPVSIGLMLMSAVFWVVIFLVVYHAVSLYSLYTSIADETDLEGTCQAQFSPQLSVNLERVMRYPRGTAGPYLLRFRPERMAHVEQQTSHDGLPPFVTGVSSKTFFSVQGLIKQFRKDIPELKEAQLIIYDIGLYTRERELLEKYCDCDVRTFQFSAFPDHVANLALNAWKPIIIQNVIDEAGSAIYMDPGMRLKSFTSLNILKHRGDREFFVWDAALGEATPRNVLGYTFPQTFKFLQESRCAFSDALMVATDVIVVFGSNATWSHVMKPWLICSLNEDCIAPSGARTSYCFHVRRPMTTGCHMFDQSALSIILNRGFQITMNRNQFVSQRIAYRAEEEVLMFEEQPWTNSQLLIIFSVIIFILAAYPLIKKRRRLPFKLL